MNTLSNTSFKIEPFVYNLLSAKHFVDTDGNLPNLDTSFRNQIDDIQNLDSNRHDMYNLLLNIKTEPSDWDTKATRLS